MNDETLEEKYGRLDATIRRSSRELGESLHDMHESKAYKTAGYSGFRHYLNNIGIAKTTAYRWIAEFIQHAEVSRIGSQLELNASQETALYNINPSNRRAVIDLALVVTDALQDTLTAKRIEHIGAIIDGIQATGAVDIGDGISTVLTAAVMQDELERIERQAEHIRQRNTRHYHARNVPGFIENGRIEFYDKVELPEFTDMFISVWSEAEKEEV